MSESKREYTERELVLLKREAFLEGRGIDSATVHGPCPGERGPDGRCRCSVCVADAEKRYPLPPRVVPRVRPDPDFPEREFRVVDGQLQCRMKLGPWVRLEMHIGMTIVPTRSRIMVWHDLFTNPDRSVPDDGGSL